MCSPARVCKTPSIDEVTMEGPSIKSQPVGYRTDGCAFGIYIVVKEVFLDGPSSFFQLHGTSSSMACDEVDSQFLSTYVTSPESHFRTTLLIDGSPRVSKNAFFNW